MAATAEPRLEGWKLRCARRHVCAAPCAACAVLPPEAPTMGGETKRAHFCGRAIEHGIGVCQTETCETCPLALPPFATPTSAADGEAGLRPEVLAFAHEMERKLRRHDEKRGDSWRAEDVAWLLSRIGEELSELRLAVAADSDIVSEAADVANFALFVASASGKLALRARPLPADVRAAVERMRDTERGCVGSSVQREADIDTVRQYADSRQRHEAAASVQSVVRRILLNLAIATAYKHACVGGMAPLNLEHADGNEAYICSEADLRTLLAHLQRTEG